MYVSTDMVEQYYNMDHTTEDILRGEHLKDGMVVLIEEPTYREDLGRNLYTHQVHAARAMNRWCTVTRLKIDESQVWFVGIYGDGSKMSRSNSINAGWLVKLGSIPAEEAEEEPLNIAPEEVDLSWVKTTTIPAGKTSASDATAR